MEFGSAKYRTLISPPTRWDFGLEGNRGLATVGALTFLAAGLLPFAGAWNFSYLCQHSV